MCLSRDRIVGARLGFDVGAGGMEGAVGVRKVCVCVLVMAVNHGLRTAQRSVQ